MKVHDIAPAMTRANNHKRSSRVIANSRDKRNNRQGDIDALCDIEGLEAIRQQIRDEETGQERGLEPLVMISNKRMSANSHNRRSVK